MALQTLMLRLSYSYLNEVGGRCGGHLDELLANLCVGEFSRRALLVACISSNETIPTFSPTLPRADTHISQLWSLQVERERGDVVHGV